MLVLLNILYIVLWICLLIFIFILFLFKEFVMTCIYAMRPTVCLKLGKYIKNIIAFISPFETWFRNCTDQVAGM